VSRVRHDEDLWELYPEIGEYDWEKVEGEIKRILDNIEPGTEEFKAAYEFLEGRTEDE
jgi:hypothetical protein